MSIKTTVGNDTPIRIYRERCCRQWLEVSRHAACHHRFVHELSRLDEAPSELLPRKVVSFPHLCSMNNWSLHAPCVCHAPCSCWFMFPLDFWNSCVRRRKELQINACQALLYPFSQDEIENPVATSHSPSGYVLNSCGVKTRGSIVVVLALGAPKQALHASVSTAHLKGIAVL